MAGAVPASGSGSATSAFTCSRISTLSPSSHGNITARNTEVRRQKREEEDGRKRAAEEVGYGDSKVRYLLFCNLRRVGRGDSWGLPQGLSSSDRHSQGVPRGGHLQCRGVEVLERVTGYKPAPDTWPHLRADVELCKVELAVAVCVNGRECLGQGAPILRLDPLSFVGRTFC